MARARQSPQAIISATLKNLPTRALRPARAYGAFGLRAPYAKSGTDLGRMQVASAAVQCLHVLTEENQAVCEVGNPLWSYALAMRCPVLGPVRVCAGRPCCY
eukprot:3826963-Rhodomonas_salina.3